MNSSRKRVGSPVSAPEPEGDGCDRRGPGSDRRLTSLRGLELGETAISGTGIEHLGD